MQRPGRKSEGDTSPQANYMHCHTVYKAMMDEATMRTDEDTGRDMVVWEGMLTTLITGRCSLSIPYYSKITTALKDMGCIRQIKRGGGSAQSVWELITEPTEELYNERPAAKKLPRQDRLTQQAAQINSLNNRVGALEHALQRFLDYEQENTEDPHE